MCVWCCMCQGASERPSNPLPFRRRRPRLDSRRAEWGSGSSRDDSVRARAREAPRAAAGDLALFWVSRARRAGVVWGRQRWPAAPVDLAGRSVPFEKNDQSAKYAGFVVTKFGKTVYVYVKKRMTNDEQKGANCATRGYDMGWFARGLRACVRACAGGSWTLVVVGGGGRKGVEMDEDSSLAASSKGA